MIVYFRCANAYFMIGDPRKSRFYYNKAKIVIQDSLSKASSEERKDYMVLLSNIKQKLEQVDSILESYRSAENFLLSGRYANAEVSASSCEHECPAFGSASLLKIKALLRMGKNSDVIATAERIAMHVMQQSLLENSSREKDHKETYGYEDSWKSWKGSVEPLSAEWLVKSMGQVSVMLCSQALRNELRLDEGIKILSDMIGWMNINNDQANRDIRNRLMDELKLQNEIQDKKEAAKRLYQSGDYNVMLLSLLYS